MKKYFLFYVVIIIMFLFLTADNLIRSHSSYVLSQEFKMLSPPKIAIIIDDFGQDRNGVKEMIEIGRPITVAIMPFMEFTKTDAEHAYQMGQEVILHLPMQGNKGDNVKWYPPNPILIDHGYNEAYVLTKNALSDIPHATGANVHIGSKTTEKKQIVSAVIDACVENEVFFVDSYTSSKSVCKEVAEQKGISFLRRDVFLEHEEKSKSYVKKQLKKAVKLAKQKGYAVVIGHVGHEGGKITVDGIKESFDYFDSEGIELVSIATLIKELRE